MVVVAVEGSVAVVRVTMGRGGCGGGGGVVAVAVVLLC